MRHLRTLVFAAASLAGTAVHAVDLRVLGITPSNTLVSFMSDSNAGVTPGPTITGLSGGDVTIVGSDFRVANGLLYVLGRAGGVYTVDVNTGAATQVSQLTTALEGTAWDIDFNPAADRLRIVSDSGQNLRHNVNSGGTTLVDDVLDYPPGTPVNTLGPTATGVSGAAYTNNDVLASSATSLYVIDTNRDQIALSSPPNNGSLAATGLVGGDVAAGSVSFDIFTTRNREGLASNNMGVAVMTVNGVTGVYVIRLLEGIAARRYVLNTPVSHIAIPVNQ